MTVMAPKDEDELRHMLLTASKLGKPVAVRYPRERSFNVKRTKLHQIENGKAEVIKEGNMLTVVSIGTVFQEAMKAANILEEEGVETTLINARFVKPIDGVIAEHINRTKKAIIIEENSIKGGFGSAVLELCHANNIKADIELIGIPDNFIEHGSQEQLRKKCGISVENIVEVGRRLIAHSDETWRILGRIHDAYPGLRQPLV